MQVASAIHCRFYFINLNETLLKRINPCIFFQGGVVYQGGAKKGGCVGVSILFFRFLVFIEQ